MIRAIASSRLGRIVVALLPLSSVPLLIELIGMGRISLGGGEKDLVWVAPWMLWALLFAGCSLLLWRRGWSFGRATTRATLVALAGVVAAAVVLAGFGVLGIAGRF